MRDNFYPALVRQYGEIAGPYVIQTDGCQSINGGVRRFNAHMGYEALRIIFRGKDENDPRVRQRGCGGWGVSSSSTRKAAARGRVCSASTLEQHFHDWLSSCLRLRLLEPSGIAALLASVLQYPRGQLWGLHCVTAGAGSLERLLAYRAGVVVGETEAHQEGEPEPRVQEGLRYARSSTAEREAHSEGTAAVALVVRCTRCGAQHREEVTRCNVS